jgi:hypothetical protein
MERASMDLPAYLGGGLYAILAVLTLVLLGDAKGRVGLHQLPAIKTALKDPLKGDSRPIPIHPDN